MVALPEFTTTLNIAGAAAATQVTAAAELKAKAEVVGFDHLQFWADLEAWWAAMSRRLVPLSKTSSQLATELLPQLHVSVWPEGGAKLASECIREQKKEEG